MANRVTPAFRFLFQQLNLNTGHSYSLSFFLSVTHHCNTYKQYLEEREVGLDEYGEILYNRQAMSLGGGQTARL